MRRPRIALVVALIVLACALTAGGYQLGRYRSRNAVYRTQAILAFANYANYRDISGFLENKCYDNAFSFATAMRDAQIRLLSDNLRKTGNAPDLLAYFRSRDPELMKSVLSGHVPKYRSVTTNCAPVP